MRTSSRKAKGRRLQNWVRDELLKLFTQFTDEDIFCAIMGESGADVKFSPQAQKLLPYSVECKNKETFKGIYDVMKQAKSNTKITHIPLGIIKMNNELPLALIDAKVLFNMMRENVKR
jgi:hypothetical protein